MKEGVLKEMLECTRNTNPEGASDDSPGGGMLDYVREGERAAGVGNRGKSEWVRSLPAAPSRCGSVTSVLNSLVG